MLFRSLRAEVASLAAAERIDARARALGMVLETPGRSDKLSLAAPRPAGHTTAPASGAPAR